MGKRKLTKRQIFKETALTYFMVTSPIIYCIGLPVLAVYIYIQDGFNKDYTSAGYPHLAAFRFYGTILLLLTPITVPISLAIDLIKIVVSPVAIPLMFWYKLKKN